MSLSQVTTYQISQYLDRSTSAYQKNLTQLSSGNKYSSLSENPVVVSESTKLQIGINSNTRLQSNIAMGGDMLTMTAGYQDNVLSNITRIKDLTIEAGNGSFTDSEKNDIYDEIQSRLSAINSLSSSANFNGIKLMDGTSTGINIRYGSNQNQSINVDSVLMDTSSTGLDINITATSGATWDSASIDSYLGKLDIASAKLTSSSSQIGAITNRLDGISDDLTSQTQSLSAYKSSIMDTDTAEISAEAVQNQIREQITATLFTQAGEMSKMRTQLFVGS